VAIFKINGFDVAMSFDKLHRTVYQTGH
jgi:hypothetical protein